MLDAMEPQVRAVIHKKVRFPRQDFSVSGASQRRMFHQKWTHSHVTLPAVPPQILSPFGSHPSRRGGLGGQRRRNNGVRGGLNGLLGRLPFALGKR
jgi:hypothetical protein